VPLRHPPVSDRQVWVMLATAYVASCHGCTGVMASGVKADHRGGYVAASPKWPIGTCLELELSEGEWSRRTVMDRGPSSRLHVDLLVGSVEEAISWGRREIRVRDCGGPDGQE